VRAGRLRAARGDPHARHRRGRRRGQLRLDGWRDGARVQLARGAAQRAHGLCARHRALASETDAAGAAAGAAAVGAATVAGYRAEDGHAHYREPLMAVSLSGGSRRRRALGTAVRTVAARFPAQPLALSESLDVHILVL